MPTKQSIPLEVVRQFIADELQGVVPRSTWGEEAYFYNPGHRLKYGTYFCTIKQKDGDNDRASKVSRPGIWRLNVGVSKPTYKSLFGDPPARPGKGRTIEGPWDFSEIDKIMPHPVYGWMSWIAVLSPSEATWRKCMPLVIDAHSRAVSIFDRRVR